MIKRRIMNIIVCIRQVSATNKAIINPKTETIVRSGTATKINPFDLFSLEAALRLNEKHREYVDIITMRPR